MTEKNYQTGVGLTVAELYQPVVKHGPVKPGELLVEPYGDQCVIAQTEPNVLKVISIPGGNRWSDRKVAGTDFHPLNKATIADLLGTDWGRATRNGVKLSEIYAEPKSSPKPLRIGDRIKSRLCGEEYIIGYSGSNSRVVMVNLGAGTYAGARTVRNLLGFTEEEASNLIGIPSEYVVTGRGE